MNSESLERKPAVDCSSIWLHLSGKIRALAATALSSPLSSFSSESLCVTLRLAKTSTPSCRQLGFFLFGFLNEKHHVSVLVATSITLYYCDIGSVELVWTECKGRLRQNNDHKVQQSFGVTTGAKTQGEHTMQQQSADTIAEHIWILARFRSKSLSLAGLFKDDKWRNHMRKFWAAAWIAVVVRMHAKRRR